MFKDIVIVDKILGTLQEMDQYKESVLNQNTKLCMILDPQVNTLELNLKLFITSHLLQAQFKLQEIFQLNIQQIPNRMQYSSLSHPNLQSIAPTSLEFLAT